MRQFLNICGAVLLWINLMKTPLENVNPQQHYLTSDVYQKPLDFEA